MKNLLAQTKVSKKTLTIKDFYEITKHAVNVKVGEQLTPVCRRQALGCKIPQTVVRGYFVGNILWLYCTNGVLYAFDGKSFVNKLNCGNSVPTLAEIKVQGQDRVLVLTNSNATILGENNLSVSMPYGSEICIYNGRIFIASDNTLYFGKQYDFNNFSVQVGEYNFINLDKTF